jgi:GAF domain-containing protein
LQFLTAFRRALDKLTADAASNVAMERERDVRDLTFLLEAAQSVSETLDRERILAAAVRRVQQGVSRPGANKSAHASFHAVAGEEATISTVVDEPADREHALGFSYATDRNQAARGAIRSGRAAIVRPDHMTGPLLDLAMRLDWEALVMAPVFSSGQLVGLLAAANRDSAVVEKRQLRMLEVLAGMTGMALANAEDFEHERSETRRLSDVATAERLLESDESHPALDAGTGLLRRELGLLALRRDVARAHRTLLGRHCLAVIAIRSVDGARPAAVLAAVAAALRGRLREEDLIFLNSDTEIVCSLSDVDVETAWPIFNDIRTDLLRKLGGAPFSIGLTGLRQEQSAEEAVAAARSAVAPVPVNSTRPRSARPQGAVRH